ncbi:MAG: sel1 repeat family protein [Acidobacteria bacterium]|nr:sel1 repeat family protein [Acidobacteriota bacterium]
MTSDRAERRKLLLKAFGIALGVTFIGMCVGVLIQGEPGFLGIVLFTGPFFFPGYLLVWPMERVQDYLPGHFGFSNTSSLAFIGWLVYAGVAIAATQAPSRRTWKLLFALFVVLLCGNVVGCWYGFYAPGRLLSIAPIAPLSTEETVQVDRTMLDADQASARLGNADSQAKLGSRYAEGRDVPRNDTQACLWWDLAATAITAPSENRGEWVRSRDAVCQRLSPAQRATVEAQVVMCRASGFKDCGELSEP